MWQLSSIMKVPGQSSETTLRFLKDGSALALIARQGADRKGIIGMAKAPYRDWTYPPPACPSAVPTSSNCPMANSSPAPVVSAKPPAPHMVLFAMTPTSLTPILELPSSGDYSYPGMYTGTMTSCT